MKKNIRYFSKFKIWIYITLMIFIFMTTTYAESKMNMSYVYFGSQNERMNQVQATKNSLHVISPSYFDLHKDGNLKLTSSLDPSFIENMHKRGIKVTPFLSNHWNQEIGRNALYNKETLIKQIVKAIDEYNLDGINIDIENINEQDRNQYTQFMALLRDELSKEKIVSAAVAANPHSKTTGWAGAYDYEALGKIVDYLVIMTYDESYRGGKVGPVASHDFVEKSILYGLKYVPSEKIVMGIPFYGRYWKEGNAVGGDGISLVMIDKLIQDYDSNLTYDLDKQSPKVTLTIQNDDSKSKVYGKALETGKYTIWYENERSIKNKLMLVQKYHLKGTASWSLGQETKDIWNYYNVWLNGDYFIDTKGHWAREAILKVYSKGWMDGTSSTYFGPDHMLTRAEIATILCNVLGLEDAKFQQFEDVTKDHWAFKSIGAVKHKGIMVGDEEGNFYPNQIVKREEMAAILDSIIHQSGKNIVSFKDISSTDWAYPYIMKAAKLGVFVGYEDGTFRPKEKMTRAQIASLICQLQDKGYLSTKKP